jgi:hypothetical protein
VASATVRRDDLYEVLGLTPDASSDEIAAAFRCHAKRLHPDRNPGDLRAAEQFKELTLAYQTLIRPGSREAYDERHHQPARSAPTGPVAPTATHDPIFRTPRRARAAIWAGIACFALGVVSAVLMAALNTGNTAETVTLWIATLKLLICGPVLVGAGAYRLRRLATEQ